jgi:hypothetical protein
LSAFLWVAHSQAKVTNLSERKWNFHMEADVSELIALA